MSKNSEKTRLKTKDIEKKQEENNEIVETKDDLSEKKDDINEETLEIKSGTRTRTGKTLKQLKESMGKRISKGGRPKKPMVPEPIEYKPEVQIKQEVSNTSLPRTMKMQINDHWLNKDEEANDHDDQDEEEEEEIEIPKGKRAAKKVVEKKTPKENKVELIKNMEKKFEEKYTALSNQYQELLKISQESLNMKKLNAAYKEGMRHASGTVEKQAPKNSRVIDNWVKKLDNK